MCFRVLFESLHGRGTVDVGGELVPQSGTIIGTMAYQGTPQKCVCVCVCVCVSGRPSGPTGLSARSDPGHSVKSRTVWYEFSLHPLV